MIFLRPYWLLLLFVPLILAWVKRQAIVQNPWKKYVDPILLPYITVIQKSKTTRLSSQKVCWIIWTLMTIALSGPAVDKLPVPTVHQNPATVLVVDLNTLNDSKTTLLHVKLYDLIRQLKDNQVGLVLYDSKGYIALPLTLDKAVLNDLIPSLQVSVLPSVGNDVSKGFEKAIELLQNTRQRTGRILLVTGGTPDIEKALPMIQNVPYKIGVLGIGSNDVGEPIVTKNGSFLRDSKGNMVLSKPDSDVLSQLGTYQSSTPTGHEISKLLKATQPSDKLFLQNQDSILTSLQADVWRDLGVYIAFVALPFLAYLFRKGLFFVLWIGFIMTATNARADLWNRPDQISYQQMQQANDAYRRQDYQHALSLYNQDSSDTALFNRGNTLAHMGQYQQAIQTYEELLNKNPNHADALFNKKYLEEQLKNQQQNQSSPDSNNEQSSDKNDTSKQQEEQSPSNQEHTSDESDKSNDMDKQDTQSKQNQENMPDDQTKNNTLSQQNSRDFQSQSDETKNDKSDFSDLSDSQDMSSDVSDENETTSSDVKDDIDLNNTKGGGQVVDAVPSDELDQETQQIINRLPRDPYRILRYRLHQQYQRN